MLGRLHSQIFTSPSWHTSWGSVLFLRTYKEFNSELGDMMSEGLDEYLAMKATEHFFA